MDEYDDNDEPYYMVEVTTPDGQRWHAGPYEEKEAFTLSDELREKMPKCEVMTCILMPTVDELVECILECLWEDSQEE
jgi:hypothetical protein